MASRSRFTHEGTAPILLKVRHHRCLLVPKRTRLLTGFTLIEILITTVIAVALVSLGLFVSLDFYPSYAFRAERSIVVGLLEKARSQALANIDEQPHGVHLETGNYVLFTGALYDPASPSNESIPANASVHIQSSSSPFSDQPIDIDFVQLSGEISASTDFRLSDGLHTSVISINNEGTIDW